MAVINTVTLSPLSDSAARSGKQEPNPLGGGGGGRVPLGRWGGRDMAQLWESLMSHRVTNHAD